MKPIKQTSPGILLSYTESGLVLTIDPTIGTIAIGEDGKFIRQDGHIVITPAKERGEKKVLTIQVIQKLVDDIQAKTYREKAPDNPQKIADNTMAIEGLLSLLDEYPYATEEALLEITKLQEKLIVASYNRFGDIAPSKKTGSSALHSEVRISIQDTHTGKVRDKKFLDILREGEITELHVINDLIPPIGSSFGIPPIVVTDELVLKIEAAFATIASKAEDAKDGEITKRRDRKYVSTQPLPGISKETLAKGLNAYERLRYSITFRAMNNLMRSFLKPEDQTINSQVRKEMLPILNFAIEAYEYLRNDTSINQEFIESYLGYLKLLKSNCEKHAALQDKVAEKRQSMIAEAAGKKLILEDLSERLEPYARMVEAGKADRYFRMLSAIYSKSSPHTQTESEPISEADAEVYVPKQPILLSMLTSIAIGPRIATMEELTFDITENLPRLQSTLGRPLTAQERIDIARRFVFMAARASTSIKDLAELDSITKAVSDLLEPSGKKAKKPEYDSDQAIDANLIMADLANIKCAILQEKLETREYDLLTSRTSAKGRVYKESRPKANASALVDERNVWRTDYKLAIEMLAKYAGKVNDSLSAVEMPRNFTGIVMSLDSYNETYQRFHSVEQYHSIQDEKLQTNMANFQVAYESGLIPKAKDPSTRISFATKLRLGEKVSSYYESGIESIQTLGRNLENLRSSLWIKDPKNQPSTQFCAQEVTSVSGGNISLEQGHVITKTTDSVVVEFTKDKKFVKFKDNETLYSINTDDTDKSLYILTKQGKTPLLFRQDGLPYVEMPKIPQKSHLI